MTLAEAVTKDDKAAIVEILRNAPSQQLWLPLWLPRGPDDPLGSIRVYTWVFQYGTAGDYQVQVVPSGE